MQQAGERHNPTALALTRSSPLCLVASSLTPPRRLLTRTSQVRTL